MGYLRNRRRLYYTWLSLFEAKRKPCRPSTPGLTVVSTGVRVTATVEIGAYTGLDTTRAAAASTIATTATASAATVTAATAHAGHHGGHAASQQRHQQLLQHRAESRQEVTYSTLWHGLGKRFGKSFWQGFGVWVRLGSGLRKASPL